MAQLKLSAIVKGSVPVTADAPLQSLLPRVAQPVIRGQLILLMGDLNNCLLPVNELVL